MVARKLVMVSPDVLQNLANKIESEKTLKDLSSEEKFAMDLLRRVNISISSRISGFKIIDKKRDKKLLWSFWPSTFVSYV
jgi:hypothetical protein